MKLSNENHRQKQTSPELLLPVGTMEMALAAIHNGADAIYIGMPGFNARGRSHDFDFEELKKIIELCHLYGVKINMAFNIVIFQDEIEKVIELLYKVIPLKPDAFIVQDLGLVQIIKKIAPDQVIHASTQMTITNDLAIKLLKSLQIKRFVLARENSLQEIKLIKEKTSEELEVFVHGALCVSYSGQCFTSESLGGRSANRGQCAQSCRFSYELLVDRNKKNTNGRDYLVSPQDLCGLEEIPRLIELGVSSFKVEGRLKSPEYVASVASSYRQVIDNELKNGDIKTEVDIKTEFVMNQKKEMAVQYSRGFYPGWLHGVQHQKLVDGTYSAHRGYPIGKIVDLRPSALVIEITQSLVPQLLEELKKGDGVFWSYQDNLQKKEGGSFIFSVKKISENILEIGIAREVLVKRQMIGSLIYLNHDKNLRQRLSLSYSDKNQFKKIPVVYEVTLELNAPLVVSLSDGKFECEEESEQILVLASNHGISEQAISEELAALGGTVFKAKDIRFNWKTSEKLFINNKQIKVLRQKLTEKLTRLRSSARIDFAFDTDQLHIIDDIIIDDIKRSAIKSIAIKSDATDANFSTKLNILLRDKDQVDDLILAYKNELGATELIDSVVLDFEFGRDYEGSLKKLKDLNIKTGLATTRILKPQEYNNLKIIKSLRPDVILVRNLGALYYFTQENPIDAELRGDFSLNVTNHLSAEFLFQKGLKTLCASYDLNKQQVSSLLRASIASNFEVTVHQTLPSFHMEHCVFAAFLSQGSSYKDCGKPCEKHKVQLKDQFGNFHWIKPDQECRNTMFNAKSQTAAKFIPEWQNEGLGFVRFEALNEKGHDLISKIKNYIQLLSHTKKVDDALVELASLENYGLSEGSLSRSHTYQSRKKDITLVQRNR